MSPKIYLCDFFGDSFCFLHDITQGNCIWGIAEKSVDCLNLTKIWINSSEMYKSSPQFTELFKYCGYKCMFMHAVTPKQHLPLTVGRLWFYLFIYFLQTQRHHWPFSKHDSPLQQTPGLFWTLTMIDAWSFLTYLSFLSFFMALKIPVALSAPDFSCKSLFFLFFYVWVKCWRVTFFFICVGFHNRKLRKDVS